MTQFAVNGRVLFVDLSAGACSVEEVPAELYADLLGGVGLAAHYLYQRMPAQADPLGPDNLLAFTTGLLTGTGAVFAGRWMAAAKSPLTGTWGEANCGGSLALALKRSGFDAVFVRGISPTPVTLFVHDGRAELLDAADLWGQDTGPTEEELKSRLGRNAAVACIGPAGEKLSLISGITNDGGRLAARSGLGAVMGSKRLKALVARGSGKITAAEPEQMRILSQRAVSWSKLQPNLHGFFGYLLAQTGRLMAWLPWQFAQDGLLYKTLLRRWGTVSLNQMSVEMGDAPVRNWAGSNLDYPFQKSYPVGPERILEKQTKHYACSLCPLGCGGVCALDEDGTEGHKPEYESVNAFGALLLNSDLDSIFRANELCNQAGIDTISTGTVIAFAIECQERGLLTPAESGLDLRWGNSQAILALLEQIIERKGIGDWLADGVKRAAERLGGEKASAADEFAVHAGGQELPMHDPRGDPGFGLHYAVEPMPGRHTVGAQLYYEMFQLWHKLPDLPRGPDVYHKDVKYSSDPRHAEEAVACSRFNQVLNGAGLCLFGAMLGVQRVPVFEWLNAAAGWNYTPANYMRAGARVQALKQLFNAREGIPLRHTVSRRALGLPKQKEGANWGRSVELDELVRQYWAISGWDEQTGLPLPETLRELGLPELTTQ